MNYWKAKYAKLGWEGTPQGRMRDLVDCSIRSPALLNCHSQGLSEEHPLIFHNQWAPLPLLTMDKRCQIVRIVNQRWHFRSTSVPCNCNLYWWSELFWSLEKNNSPLSCCCPSHPLHQRVRATSTRKPHSGNQLHNAQRKADGVCDCGIWIWIIPIPHELCTKTTTAFKELFLKRLAWSSLFPP